MTGLPLPRLREKKQEHLLEKKHCINNHKISKPWEGENELVCYHQHSYLQHCRHYFTNTVDAMVMVWLTSQKETKSWNVFDNTGGVLPQTAIIWYSWGCNYVLHSSANKPQQNSNISSEEDYIYLYNFDCFVVDLWHLHLTSVIFCVLSVLREQ